MKGWGLRAQAQQLNSLDLFLLFLVPPFLPWSLHSKHLAQLLDRLSRCLLSNLELLYLSLLPFLLPQVPKGNRVSSHLMLEEGN